MRRRTLICFWLSCFVMLFWCPVFERMLEDIIWMALHLPFSTKACFSTLLKFYYISVFWLMRSLLFSLLCPFLCVSLSLSLVLSLYLPDCVHPSACHPPLLFIFNTWLQQPPASLLIICLLSLIYTSQYLTVIFRAQELCEREGGLGSHSLPLRP